MIGETLSPRPSDLELRSRLLAEGAIFTSEWPVRGDDISHDRRLKFDGVARCLQDIGQDHLETPATRRSTRTGCCAAP